MQTYWKWKGRLRRPRRQNVRGKLTAHIKDSNIADKLLAELRLPQGAYGKAICQEKGIEHSRTLKINPFGPSTSTSIKQDFIGYIQPREKRVLQNYQNNQRGRGQRGRQNFP